MSEAEGEGGGRGRFVYGDGAAQGAEKALVGG